MDEGLRRDVGSRFRGPTPRAPESTLEKANRARSQSAERRADPSPAPATASGRKIRAVAENRPYPSRKPKRKGPLSLAGLVDAPRRGRSCDFEMVQTHVIAVKAAAPRGRRQSAAIGVFRFPAFPLSQFSNFPIFRFPNFPLSQFSNFPLSRFPAFPLSQFSQFSQFSNFPIFQFPAFPIFQFSAFPLFRPYFPLLRLSDFFPFAAPGFSTAEGSNARVRVASNCFVQRPSSSRTFSGLRATRLFDSPRSRLRS